jgi:hypothetical protein
MKATQQNVSLDSLRIEMNENVLTAESTNSIKGGVSGLRARYKPRQSNGGFFNPGVIIPRLNGTGNAVEGLL